MTERRTYGDSCGIARALDRIGERWALLVVRELMLGPKRFTDLRDGLPSVSPDVLAQRLRELEAAGVLRRRKLAPPAAARVYELTEWGAELEPVLLALGRWGSAAALPSSPPELSPDALAIALQTTFDPVQAATLGTCSYQLRLGEHDFILDLAGGQLKVSRGQAEHPVATLETDPGTLTRVLWHGHTLADALHARALRITGARREVSRLLVLFAVSEPALAAPVPAH